MSDKLFFNPTSIYVSVRVGFGLRLVPLIVEPDMNLGWTGS